MEIERRLEPCHGALATTKPVTGALLPLADADVPPACSRRATQLRLVSLFRQGWITILVALLNPQRLPQGRFVPEPWPQPRTAHSQKEPYELLPAA